ncbi:transcriptional regulator [Ochrobactrum sp. XJ1]|nr:transcriptional regulator [Ochrobactrum sp. XJ1]
MKKINRSFTVEYKNARRRSERKPDSIWGDLDLKSVAQQANEATVSSTRDHGDASQVDEPIGQDRSIDQMLTPALQQSNNASEIEEIHMPDEMETVTETNTQEPVVALAAPLKQRKPRIKKADPDQSQVTAAPGGADATEVRGKRGRKAGAIVAARTPRSKLIKSESNISDASSTAPVDAIDDIAELLRLEDENRNLRKQLSEKLRAENADLRKRLNLA